MSDSEKTMKRVLVADDDDSIRRLLITLVRRENLEVDAAADGQEAIALLKQKRYDVILLDLMMPRVDGFGVVEYLRTHTTEPKPVVLVITAYADQTFKEVDSDIVAGVIRKPFEVFEIAQLVRLCTSRDSAARKILESSSDRAIRNLVILRGNSPESDSDDGGSVH